MDFEFYLDKFQKAANKLDRKQLSKKKMETAVGVYLDSVFLKLYKNSWANNTPDPLTSPSRIFFSIWINDKVIKDQKLFYNIHALKLRQLQGYRITSRVFAEKFRAIFKKEQKNWPNVSVEFGPQTLIQGWVKLDLENLQMEIVKLANRFLKMDFMIDQLLKSLAYF